MKKKIFLIIINLFIILLLFQFNSLGAIIYTTVNPQKIYVGDRAQFIITLIVPKGATVKPPDVENNLGKIVVKEWNVRKREKEKSDSLFYEYLITTYSPEPCTIPSLNFIIETAEKSETLHTEPIPLQVITLVKSDSADLKDIKPPFKAGKPPKWWIVILISIIVIIIVVISYNYLAKKFAKVPPPPPPIPPYEEAIEALRNLGLKKYIQRGLFREYVFELSEIFKRYIGRVFNCNALEFTTEEILEWMKKSEMSTKLKKIIEYFFETTDPVKFARYVPEVSVLERLEKEVREFLEETKPKEETLEDSKREETGVPRENKENKEKSEKEGKLTK